MPAVAVDPQPVAGLDSLRCPHRSDDSRKAVFPRDDGRVTHDAADIGDGGDDLAEDRRPARRRRRRDEDVPLLELVELLGPKDHPRAALDDARGAREPVEYGRVVAR